MQEQELFQSYEVKNWDFSGRIYKILAVSAIFNILALLIVAQSNLLTTKGCDSPLVGKVCQVIDTLYVGGKIISTDSETGSVPYDPTTISPDDEIVFVNVADKLYYPEGYFAQSNPNLAMMMNPDGTYLPTDNSGFTDIPGIPNPTTGGGTTDLLSQPPVLPKVNKNPINGVISDSPFGFDVNPTVKPPKNQIQQKYPRIKDKRIKQPVTPNNTSEANTDVNKITPKVTPTPDSEDVAKEDNNGIFRNKKPLKDFAVKAKEEVKTAKLDAPFTVIIEADLEYGADKKTVVLKNPKSIKPDPQIPNDPVMAKLAQDAILAIGDSGWLGYLKTLGVKKVVFTLSQNDTEMTATIKGDQKDENTAKTMASGLNTFIQIGLKTADGDEKVLLEKASTTAEGKAIILNFVIPKQIALEMINRKLKEAEEKQAESKPLGSKTQVNDSNKTAVK